MPAWAAVFDWDGVIVDSASQHEASWERLAREEGLQLPDGHFRRGFGMKNEVIIPELLGWSREPARIKALSLRKEALYREIVRETGLAALPGVVRLLDGLRAAGVPCAVGSSTHRENITCVLELLGLADRFGVIVAAEDVSRGKPDPQVFVAAASRLGMDPARCVVFEDTPVGIAAARAAGMPVVAVGTTHPETALSGADRIVQRLDRLTVADLNALLQQPDSP